MTLREFISNLNKLAEETPEALDLNVIYAKDDEGNGFQFIKVNCKPEVGVIPEESYYVDSFYPKDEYTVEFLEEKLEEDPEFKVVLNAVCIN